METVFVGEARDYAYEMKRDVYNDPPTNANPPLRYELGIALEDGLPDEPDTAEHADIPVVKVIFPPAPWTLGRRNAD